MLMRLQSVFSAASWPHRDYVMRLRIVAHGFRPRACGVLRFHGRMENRRQDDVAGWIDKIGERGRRFHGLRLIGSRGDGGCGR